MLEQFKISLIRDVRIPSRANKFDAGIDLYVPNDLTNEDFIKCNKTATLIEMSKNNARHEKIDENLAKWSKLPFNEQSSAYTLSLEENQTHGITGDDSNKIMEIDIGAHDRILIPSGIKVNVPEGFAFILMNKSGISTKRGLAVGACVVDTGYQGEVHISLINTTGNVVTVKAGEKIVQGILMPVANIVPDVVSIDELYAAKSSRGEGGFGSTGI